jgi:hypothetical protein
MLEKMTSKSTSELLEYRDYLTFRLSRENPTKNYFRTPARRRAAQWELKQIQKELRKKQRELI